MKHDKGIKLSKLASYLLQLEQQPAKAGKFYLTIKMHKNPPATRPIINTIDTPTYYASKYLHDTLAPIMKAGKTYLQNSESLLLSLENLSLPSSVTLLSADVKDLYPSIPIIEGLQALNYKLTQQVCWDADTVKFIVALAEFVLTNNIFEYNNTLYIQIFGTAMGTTFAVVYANIYLDVLETEIWRSFTNQVQYNKLLYPFLLKRYIDDIFALFPTIETAVLYVTLYNQARESIKLLPVYGDSVTVLDLTIYKGSRFNSENKLDSKLYQKEMNLYLYIPPDSFHRPTIFKSFISSELKRYRRCCTHDSDYEDAKRLFYDRLVAREYTQEFLQPLFEINYSRSSLLTTASASNDDQTSNNKRNNKRPAVFKILNTPRFSHPQLKELLNVTTEQKEHPDFNCLFQGRQPIICYKRSHNVRELIVKKKVKFSINNEENL
jgi:hypothetical protein